MFENAVSLMPNRPRHRYNIWEFFHDLGAGDTTAWICLGLILGFIAFAAAYKKVTGENLVKSRKERRAAKRRRNHVLWEYHSDD